MDKIAKSFENKKANIAYAVAGFPSLDETKTLINSLDKSSIDILEIGIPYSDPIADGKTIFEASFKASNDGVNTDDVFDMLKECKTSKCLVFLVYYNLIYAYGMDEFLKRSKECEISALIVPDLPFEDNEELYDKAKNFGIALIPLISVTSLHRIDKILKRVSGFVYAVGAIGVTGSKQTPLNRLKELVATIKSKTDLPVAVGFGIRTNDDINLTKTYADGAIVGTSVVKLTAEFKGDELIKKLDELFKEK